LSYQLVGKQDPTKEVDSKNKIWTNIWAKLWILIKPIVHGAVKENQLDEPRRIKIS
jgi:hypothetical protein